MTQEQTESWKPFIGTGVTLLCLLVLTAIFYEIGLNGTWIIQNFEIGEPFRLISIASALFILIGSIKWNHANPTYKQLDLFADIVFLFATIFWIAFTFLV